MRRQLFSIAIAAVLATQGFAAHEAAGVPTAPSKGAAKYALCVGINHYSDDYGASSLTGCANDATVFRANLVELGGWASADTTLLTDSAATKKAIRAAMADIAGKAVNGDTFVYQHSSHGGWDTGTDVYLCAHDDDYWDYELAEDLESFASGVKVVVVVDACHSGGLFKGARGKGAKGGISAKQPFDLAPRVTAIMDARRAKRLARGEKAVARQLAASEIGWVTAAEYNESSIDVGFYDNDEWLTDPSAGGSISGGTFLGSFTWSWWNGRADADAGAGDNDGHFDAYEGWSVAKAFCENLDDFWNEDDSSFTPQCLNESVLRSVELGTCSPLDISPLFPPPANDDFADATEIAGASGTANGSNANATREEDEPQHNDGGESDSVWWRWTAPKDGEAQFDTKGSDFDTVMAVYTGESLDSLTQIAANDDAESGSWSRCTFVATEGTTYHIAVAGYSSAGDIVLNWGVLGEGEDYLLLVDDDGCLRGFQGNLPADLEIPAEVNGVAVTSIGKSAFDADYNDVSALESVSIPAGVTAIDAYAFYDCSNLADVSLPAGLESIGRGAFEACVSLSSVTIPASVATIGDYAFSGCKSLATVTFEGDQDDIDIGYHAFWRTPWGTLPLAAPDADNAVSLSNAMTGVYYSEMMGFTGGTPLEDEDGDAYFEIEVIDGVLPGSMTIARWRDDASNISIRGTPVDDEAGDYAFTVRVTDANGDSVEQAFTLAVAANPNHAPVIDSYSPETYDVHLEPGEEQVFSVTVSDSDEGDTITTTWYVADNRGDYVSGFDGVAGESITFSSLDEGWYYVYAYASDGNRETSQTWSVRVAKPLAAPDADNVVALPDAMTGVFYGETLGFAGGTPIKAYDDEDEHEYHYFDVEIIDGELPDNMWIDGWYGDSSDIRLYGTPGDDEAGDYAFTVRVTDANGDSVEQAFTLTVTANPNHAPVIDSYSPENYYVRLDPGEEQVFSVEAHDSDADDTVTITWYVKDGDGYYVTGFDGVAGESISFSTMDEGRYTVDVYVSDGDRETSQSWSVQVKETKVLSAPDAGGAVALPDAMTGVYYWDADADDYVRLGFTGGTPLYDDWDGYSFDVEIIDGTLPDSMWIADWYGDSSDIRIYGTPGDDEAGDYAFTIRVTDANGDSVEQAFTLTVAANPNHAPIIDSYSPKNNSVRLEPGEEQVFSVEAHDPDEGDTITITWYVEDAQGDYVSGFAGVAGESITFSSLDEGWYDVYAYVSDGERKTSLNWSVQVKEKEPLAAPDADNAMALPAALTGVAYQDDDTGDYVRLGFTGGIPIETNGNFYYDIEVVAGKLPESMWICGSHDDAARIHFDGTPDDDEAGDYAFTVRVTDANGDSVEQSFTLTVAANPNHAPVIDSYSPDKYDDIRLEPGEEQVFSVEAHDPDEDDAVTITWVVFDDSWVYVPGFDDVSGESLTFSSLHEGIYYVYANVSDGQRTTYLSWSVEVASSSSGVTVVDGVAIPDSFLEQYPSLYDGTDGDSQAALRATAANGVNKAWECYVTGLDPTSESAAFQTTFSLDENGNPVIGWTPKLPPEEEAKRKYTEMGKTNLMDGGWVPVTDSNRGGMRFFSVTVEMK